MESWPDLTSVVPVADFAGNFSKLPLRVVPRRVSIHANACVLRGLNAVVPQATDETKRVTVVALHVDVPSNSVARSNLPNCPVDASSSSGPVERFETA